MSTLTIIGVLVIVGIMLFIFGSRVQRSTERMIGFAERMVAPMI